MQYIKNIAFTKLIKADGRFREFNFRKKHSSGNPLYDIDVSDERGNRHYFVAVKIEGHWQIGELNVAPWIREAAGQLHSAIEEYEAAIGE